MRPRRSSWISSCRPPSRPAIAPARRDETPVHRKPSPKPCRATAASPISAPALGPPSVPRSLPATPAPSIPPGKTPPQFASSTPPLRLSWLRRDRAAAPIRRQSRSSYPAATCRERRRTHPLPRALVRAILPARFRRPADCVYEKHSPLLQCRASTHPPRTDLTATRRRVPRVLRATAVPAPLQSHSLSIQFRKSIATSRCPPVPGERSAPSKWILSRYSREFSENHRALPGAKPAKRPTLCRHRPLPRARTDG